MGISTSTFSPELMSLPQSHVRPLRIKQVKDIAEMIANSYKAGLLTYPKVFQCDNGSEFKAEVPKMLEKHGVNDTMHNDEVQACSHGICQGFE